MITTPAEVLVAIGLHLALVLAALGCVRQLHLSTPHHRRERLLFTALALVLPPLCLAFAHVPADWVTPLQEGASELHLRQFAGEGAHTGSGFRAMLAVALAGRVSTMQFVAALNLSWSLLAAILFAAHALHALGRWSPTLLLTVIFVGNRFMLNGALSELPGPYLACLFLLGALGVAVIGSARGGGWGWATCALATVLAAWTRPEVSGLGLVALAVLAVPQHWRTRIDDRWARIPWRRVLVGWVVLVVVLRVLPMERSKLDWVLFGIAHAPLALLKLLKPLAWGGVPLLLVLPVLLAGTRDFWRTGGLAVSTLVLGSVYWQASHHEPYEHLRYGTMFLPAVLLLAARGWGLVTEWPRWREALAVLLALTAIAWPWTDTWVVSQNAQREVRAMLQLAAAQPECTFVTPACNASDRNDPNAQAHFDWGIGVFSHGKPYRFIANATPETARASKEVAGAECVMLYRGLDCNLRGAECDVWGPTAPLEWEWTFPNRPYTGHNGEHNDAIRLSVVRLR